MASIPTNSGAMTSQHLINASAAPFQDSPSSYHSSAAQVRLNNNSDEAWGIDIWRALRLQKERNGEHPSVYWCTTNDYIKKRAIATPPRLPYFDASGWCFVPEVDPSNMQAKMCHLISLPKELRLEIWRHVLTDPSVPNVALEISRAPLSPKKTSIRFPHPCIKLAINPPRERPISIDILATNDFIYREALPILYQSIQFVLLDLGSIFPIFLGTLSSFAQSHIRLIKLQIPSTIYDTPTLFANWAITCAQVAKLDDIRTVEIAGYYPEFSSGRFKDCILNPLCKVKAKKIFEADINDEAQEALMEAERYLQSQAKARTIRTMSEAAERAERDAILVKKSTMQDEVRKQTYPLLVLPTTSTSTVDCDLRGMSGIHGFEEELQEHERSNWVVETLPESTSEDKVDVDIGEWEMVSVKRKNCLFKSRRNSDMESDEGAWSDDASTLVVTEGRKNGDNRGFSCFS
jgi:hypothetical protein